MRVLAVILFVFTLIGCNKMEKKIVWDEFNTNGLSNNYQQERYVDMMFINENNGFLLGNNNIHDRSRGNIETQLYTTLDGGHNWKQVFSKQGEAVCLKRKDNTLLILQTNYPKDYRHDNNSTLCISNDLGKHWDKTIELPFQLYNIAMIDSSYWMGSCEDTIFYTTNAGLNWKTRSLLHPKTDHMPVVILPTGDIAYVSDNKLIIENVELNKSEVLKVFSDKEQYYCGNYVQGKGKGLFLIIADSKLKNFQLCSLTNYKLPLPFEGNIGIVNVSVNYNMMLVYGYQLIGNLSKVVFFYSNNDGKDWVSKDFRLLYSPSSVTFYNNKIIAYCMRSNTMIQTYLEK